jgi:hypothetical protein
MSKGEDYLVTIFRKEKIAYEREKTFSDLLGKHGAPLRFDFFLPSLGVLCEVDGAQHFQQVSKFGGRSGYMAAAERDRRKNSYCLARHIPLYRIPYWELHNIRSLSDILIPKFLVTSKFHNDYLKPP